MQNMRLEIVFDQVVEVRFTENMLQYIYTFFVLLQRRKSCFTLTV